MVDGMAQVVRWMSEGEEMVHRLGEHRPIAIHIWGVR
jgi:hypothetical protein